MPVAVLLTRADEEVGSLPPLLAAGDPGPAVPPKPLPTPVPSTESSPPPQIGVRSARLTDLPARERHEPVRVLVPAIGVDAPVSPAGVEGERRELDVPDDARSVVWYRHGPSPGEPGSAVLAGHVDLGGARAVFYRLRELKPGMRVVVAYDDGSRAAFRVVARRLYDKDRLPPLVFRAGGRAAIALITCGGSYDAESRSYRGNTVVFAVPVADAAVARS